MNRESQPENLEPTLEEVHNQFETWRQTRQKRTPIPEGLWEAAAGLSKNYTILQISKALRLNYTDLKHRVLAQDAHGIVKAEKTPTFIELDFKQPNSLPQCVIKMQKPNGSKMKLYFTAETRVDLLELSKCFWRDGS
jgi:hypothetical protein